MEILILKWGLYIVCGLCLFIFAVWAHIIFWGWYYRQTEICGPLSWIYSPDGWRIALEQVPARHGVPYQGQILCCPGLACNGRIFHFRDELSFARDMSNEGWTVWILHPRGMGPSERPFSSNSKVYGYEDYVKDGIAAMEFVRSRSEGPLLWVGHSLGGLIGIDVARRIPTAFDGMITLGTPVALKNHPIHPFYYGIFKWSFKGLKTAYLGKLSTLVAPWSGWIPALHPAPLFVNFDLINKADLRAALAQCFEDVPRRVLDEFVAAIESAGGPLHEMKEILETVQFPILAMAGDVDGLAPLEVTTPISEWVQADLIEWHVLPNFSHLELALSGGVKTIVIPKITKWWDKCSQSSNPPATLDLKHQETQHREDQKNSKIITQAG